VVELPGLLRLRTAIPIHYEDWNHFKHGRDVIEREFASAVLSDATEAAA
jgi:hypothetical protein